MQKAGIAYDLFEADEVLGGNLRTERRGSYLLETGPNSLQLSDELRDLLTDLNLTTEIQETAAVSANRYILRDGRYHRLPASPPALLTSGFFGFKAKLNLLREFVRPAAPINTQETLGAFFGGALGLKSWIMPSIHSSPVFTPATRNSCCCTKLSRNSRPWSKRTDRCCAAWPNRAVPADGARFFRCAAASKRWP
ncbi:FAD-dependent oxidoreductase [Hymenobacter qilianensis]|uniref:FAD-dependent oxidoreductase n=1 Tax=Hymenobacter qilianensis TaxID=1385715 RepID=A0A7H0GRW2_9BACT|nr:FAD-dependent oxidoreductase [Hymenobacter qilianensis]